MKIQDYTPEDYAAQWGTTTPDGAYFYNFGSEIQLRTFEWLKKFIEVIQKQIRKVEASPEDYESNDQEGLTKLLVYVQCLLIERKLDNGTR